MLDLDGSSARSLGLLRIMRADLTRALARGLRRGGFLERAAWHVDAAIVERSRSARTGRQIPSKVSRRGRRRLQQDCSLETSRKASNAIDQHALGHFTIALPKSLLPDFRTGLAEQPGR